MGRQRSGRDLALLQEEALLRLASKRLDAFIELAWPILEPGTPFVSNWHIELICEYLQAVTDGTITKLVINMPPRYGKSLLASVIWPVWEWTHTPTSRWLFVSHSETLAHKHSLDRRLLIQSEWFRARFPQVRLARDQNAKAEFHNTRRGAMVATSMGGSITGKGGDRLIIDDPHSPDQAESDAQRQQVNERFRRTLSTRLDDKQHGAILVVMQRLHTRDLTAECLDLGFEHLCLPALAPRRTTIHFPRSGKTMVREADDVLWPARENRTALDQLRLTLGTYGFSGQYQQDPIPQRDGLFPREWWKSYAELPQDESAQWVQSWDLSFKDGENNDFVAGFMAQRVGAIIYLVDLYKAKASFVETCEAIRTMRRRFPETSTILIEDAANGAAVVDTLSAEIPGILAVRPEGGKFARAHAAQSQIKAGQVLLPDRYTVGGALRRDRLWVEQFVDSCAAFPKGPHDDDVDALTQLLVWVRQHPFVVPVGVVREPETPVRHRYRSYIFGPRPSGGLFRRTGQE